jgi:predicted transcriptional regulator
MEVPSSSSVSPVPPVTAAPRPKKPRARISKRKRDKARDVATKLFILRDLLKEPELKAIVDRAAADALRLSEATRQADRKLVFEVLKSFESCETDEIIEDTGLSRWSVDLILQQFEARGFVKRISLEDPAKSGGRPRDLWTLAIRFPKK